MLNNETQEIVPGELLLEEVYSIGCQVSGSPKLRLLQWSLKLEIAFSSTEHKTIQLEDNVKTILQRTLLSCDWWLLSSNEILWFLSYSSFVILIEFFLV